MKLARLVLQLIIVAYAGSVSAVTIDWVTVGNPNNAADTLTNCYAASCGSVDYTYRISKYEVTNAQYAEFLNAKAASAPRFLYNGSMGSDADGDITRSGVSGSYTYAVKSGMGDRPVNLVTPAVEGAGDDLLPDAALAEASPPSPGCGSVSVASRCNRGRGIGRTKASTGVERPRIASPGRASKSAQISRATGGSHQP